MRMICCECVSDRKCCKNMRNCKLYGTSHCGEHVRCNEWNRIHHSLASCLNCGHQTCKSCFFSNKKVKTITFKRYFCHICSGIKKRPKSIRAKTCNDDNDIILPNFWSDITMKHRNLL